MGLDVKVFNNISISNESEGDFKAYVIDNSWEYKIKNLEKDKYYIGDFLFRGVSYPYSEHNRFREKLIKLIKRVDLLDSDGRIKWGELPKNIPFYDFIDFADNEGCLDWEISTVIYNDFNKFKDVAKLEMCNIDYAYYNTWLDTFKKASINKGVVVFR